MSENFARVTCSSLERSHSINCQYEAVKRRDGTLERLKPFKVPGSKLDDLGPTLTLKNS
jgi:hypothetical protein